MKFIEATTSDVAAQSEKWQSVDICTTISRLYDLDGLGEGIFMIALVPVLSLPPHCQIIRSLAEDSYENESTIAKMKYVTVGLRISIQMPTLPFLLIFLLLKKNYSVLLFLVITVQEQSSAFLYKRNI
jgi:hypothetical protein